MDKKLIKFLRIVLDRSNLYKNLVPRIYLKSNADNTLTVRFAADDYSLHYETTTSVPLDIQAQAGCFGNLSFLYNLLSSSLMNDDSDIEILTKENEKGQTFIQSIKFNPNKRTEFHYIATDPFRDLGTGKIPGKIDNEETAAICAVINKENLDEIKEIRKLNTSSIGGKDNLFCLTVDNDAIVLETGSGNNHSLVLELDAEIVSHNNSNLSINLPFDILIKALDVALGNSEVVALEVRNNHASVISASDFGVETMTIISRKGKVE